jgi:diguanylate cyclase (GGDEF)-like protein
MKNAPVPADESARLASLVSLDVLDTPAEERFDRITRLAKALFDVPIALVSLVDEKRQWFKSRQGLTACSTPREISFCGHAILEHAAFLVQDTLLDERFRDNPLVTGPPNIRFYAGQPLRDREGRSLGTLCIIDRRPRFITPEQLLLLADLGRIAENELVAKPDGRPPIEPVRLSQPERRERLDEVTGVWNERGIREILARGLETCAKQGLPATILRCEMDQDVPLSDTWTEQGSGIILAEIAQVLRGCVRGNDSVGRIEEQGFVLFLVGLPTAAVAARVADFQGRLGRNPVLQSIGVRLRLGFASVEPGSWPVDVGALLEAAAPTPGMHCT